MAIGTIQPTGAAAPPPPENPKGVMGKDTFMKLLVAELKNQDPMNPLESRDMITQLSQLSSVEKLSGIDKRLEDMQSSNTAKTALDSAGLVGRTATADQTSLRLTQTENPSGWFQLAAKADKVTVKIYNSSGDVVRTIDAGATGLGKKDFRWDGMTDKGMRAPSGDYSFAVSAEDAAGKLVPVSSEVTGLITEVTYESGVPEVVVGGTRIPLGDVKSIAQ